jgi:hypothetical protein
MNWISVGERLPEQEKLVLVASEYGNVDVGWVSQGSNNWLTNLACNEKVTHWMELPDPPYTDDNNYCKGDTK